MNDEEALKACMTRLRDRDSTIASLHTELATLRETVVTTNAVAADAMRESASLRTELEAAKAERDQARAWYDARQETTVRLNAQLATLQGERDALRERVTEELGEIFKLTRITSGGLPFVNYEAVSLHVSRALAATPPLTQHAARPLDISCPKCCAPAGTRCAVGNFATTDVKGARHDFHRSRLLRATPATAPTSGVSVGDPHADVPAGGIAPPKFRGPFK
jgi:hypothetical protein